MLLDLVPCHTSIEHPWFREHPDWYIWADEPNNWSRRSAGSAWAPRDGRYYLHSFYPEQPDLDWRNPEVVAAMQDVFRFWLERGVDGYRIDAIDRLLKDPELRDDPPATEPFGLPLREDEARLALTHSRNAPDIGGGARARSARPRATPSSWARSTCRAARWRAVPRALRRRVRVRAAPGPVGGRAAARRDRGEHAHAPARRWVMSNHDFGRLGHALRRARTRAPRRCCC